MKTSLSLNVPARNYLTHVPWWIAEGSQRLRHHYTNLPTRHRGRPRMSPWRVTALACSALLAVGVVAIGVYLAARPGGHTNNAVASQRSHVHSSRRPVPAQLPPLQVGTLGTYQVSRRDLTLTRPASPAGRRLRVTLRYPVVADWTAYRDRSHGAFPLVVFAPGFRQCARSYADLLREWSSAGYVVAAVDFPQTSCTIAAPDESDLVHQPADLAYVIRRLLSLSAAPGGRLAGLISPGEIGVAGHSDGGDTVAAMAGTACCHDSQVRAVLVLAGAAWPAFGGRWFARPAPPMLFVQGTADTWNFPSASVQLYQADAAGPRFYLDLPGANHFSPYQGVSSPEPIVARVTVDFLDRYLLGQRNRTTAMWRAGEVTGKAVLTSAGRLPR